MFHILLCCSSAALTGLCGVFVDAAVAASTDFSWGFVEAEGEAASTNFSYFVMLQFGSVDWFVWGFC